MAGSCDCDGMEEARGSNPLSSTDNIPSHAEVTAVAVLGRFHAEGLAYQIAYLRPIGVCQPSPPTWTTAQAGLLTSRRSLRKFRGVAAVAQ